jgi:threonine/homoserine/homoserine lactone efflux protein
MPLDAHLLLLYTLTMAVAALTPGPDMLFVLGCGVRGGPRAGLLATAGVAVSEVVHVTFAAVGLSALFATVPTLFVTVRLVGAAYLLFLGVRILRDTWRGGSSLGSESDPPMSGRRAFGHGVSTNLLNPKMVTLTIAFLPQFVDPARGHLWLQFAALGAILLVLEFAVDGTVGLLAGRISSWLRRRATVRRRLDTATGTIFIGLGLKLGLQR